MDTFDTQETPAVSSPFASAADQLARKVMAYLLSYGLIETPRLLDVFKEMYAGVSEAIQSELPNLDHVALTKAYRSPVAPSTIDDALETQEMQAVCPLEDEPETHACVTPVEAYVLARYRAAVEASHVDSMTPADFMAYAAQHDQEFASWLLQSEIVAPPLFADPEKSACADNWQSAITELDEDNPSDNGGAA
jgi:hypothetical protein